VNSHSPSPTTTGWAVEPPDPDIADAPPADLPRRTRRREQAEIIAVVSIGGMIGATARYAAGLAWPTVAGNFPWTTFAINVVGCALMGVLMVVVTEAYSAHRLLRPFLGTGILGGFTTFSTYAVDSEKLIGHPAAQIALLYLATTALGAIAAVWIGVTATRLLLLRERGTR
jgi:CrcB protein